MVDELAGGGRLGRMLRLEVWRVRARLRGSGRDDSSERAKCNCDEDSSAGHERNVDRRAADRQPFDVMGERPDQRSVT